MRTHLPGVVILGLLALLAACRSTPVQVTGGEVRNQTQEPLLDFFAAHLPASRAVYASQILPGSTFRMGIAPRDLQAKRVELSWKTTRGLACKTTLELTPPPEELRDGPCWIVYTVTGVDRVALTWQRPPY